MMSIHEVEADVIVIGAGYTGSGRPWRPGTRWPAKSSSTKSAKKSAVRSSGRPGPQRALTELIDAGYFAVPRTIQDAQKRLQQSRGYRYEQRELSTPLVRLLRNGLLQREMNGDQYEYSTP